MPKIKILYPIGSFFPSHFGGPSTSIYWLSKELSKYNFLPIIVSSSLGIDTKKVELNKFLQKDFGEVIYCKTYFHYLPLNLLRNVYYKINEADIIHLTALFYPPSWIIACLAIILKKKVIWSIRGELEPNALEFSSWKKKPILLLIQKLAQSKKINFHSTNITEYQNVLTILYPINKTVIIPNYIDIHKMEDRNPSEQYMIFLGRVHPIKALDNLVNALAKSLIFKQSTFKLFIVGPIEKQEYFTNLKHLINENELNGRILFKGELKGKEKNLALANAKFTILPSHSENFGNVVIESLAQGTPVIASLNTPWEILKTKKAGDWVSNDPDSLNVAIEKFIIMDTITYKSYRKNAVDLVRDSFDIKKNIVNWIETYNSIINVQ